MARDTMVMCMKILHTISIICTLISSASLIIIGSMMVHNFRTNTFSTESNFPTIPVILLVLGFCSTIISILGIYGCIRENQCMLKTYSLFTFIIFLIEIAIAIAAVVMSQKIEEGVQTSVKDIIKNYDFDNDTKNIADYIQKEFKCCGGDSIMDHTSLNRTIPDSCCEKPKCDVLNSYKKGCAAEIGNYLENMMYSISITVFVGSTVNIFAATFSCLLNRELGHYVRIA